MSIKSSVGRKGVNRKSDVELVQTALNRSILAPFKLLKVDGLMGPVTIRAIERFQKSAVNFSKPDGLIEVEGKTWKALKRYLTETPNKRTSTALFFSDIIKKPDVREPLTSRFQMVPSTSVVKIGWGAKVSPAFKQKVILICKELHISPDFLMACMAFETGETFSPSIPNAAGSGAVGLIQFMRPTAEGLKTSTDKLKKMSAVQQLDYVKKYFFPFKNRLKTLEDVYLAILYPAGIGKPLSHVFFRKGTKVYDQNKGLDKNGDGKITLLEIAATVREKYEKGLKPGYIG